MSLHKLSVAAALLGLAATGSQTRADFVAPTGLAPGSQYQIVFVTTDSASPTNIGETYYNNFATTEAAPLTALLPTGTTWHAITSTYDGDYYPPGGITGIPTYTNASTNAPAYAGIPIYNTQGNLVASGAAQFYGGEDLTNPIRYDQRGIDNYPFEDMDVPGPVMTGSNSFGAAATEPVFGTNAALGDMNVEAGMPWSTDPTDWLESGYWYVATGNAPPLGIYVLSSPITVPEPASFAALGIPATMVLLRRRRRRIMAR
jgi:hypothetical protein